jgi:hypothetical protein
MTPDQMLFMTVDLKLSASVQKGLPLDENKGKTVLVPTHIHSCVQCQPPKNPPRDPPIPANGPNQAGNLDEEVEQHVLSHPGDLQEESAGTDRSESGFDCP